MKVVKNLLTLAISVIAPLAGEQQLVVRTPESYFRSVQYNWEGEYDADGKKIPGDIQECYVRGLYHPLDKSQDVSDSFSVIDFKVLEGKQFNPIRFKTIKNVVTVTSGSGKLIIFDEKGAPLEYELQPHSTVVIPPQTKYSLASNPEDELVGIIVSSPAWFKEDEEYDWDLVKEFFPENK